MASEQILTFTCPDKPGIVHAVTGVLARHNLNVQDLQQFSDAGSQKFFMRVHFGPIPSSTTPDATDASFLNPDFEALTSQFGMTDWAIRPVTKKTRVLIMVSKTGHCLNDLLFRSRANLLNIEVACVVGNHSDFKDLAASYGVPFIHLPVKRETKLEQESQVLKLVEQHGVELVILARYMQILSPTMCAALPGRIINIHHSFLPSFKGAKPYHQAYDRGVKIMGATAHFVTADLDEGPIIEQRVARVDHGMQPKQLVDEGSNVETQVLAAAVKWYSERRVFVNGIKTVVFY